MSLESSRARQTPRTVDPSLVKELCRTLRRFTGADELEEFLVDLCTPEELRSLAERWRVAKLVDEGMPYRKIQALTGVSTATVTRVARTLLFGSGYRRALPPKQKIRKR